MTGLTIHVYGHIYHSKLGIVKYYQQDCDVTLYSIFLFTDRFIRNLILIIVLPLTLAALFIVVVCLKFRPTCKSSSEQAEVSKHGILIFSKCHN